RGAVRAARRAIPRRAVRPRRLLCLRAARAGTGADRAAPCRFPAAARAGSIREPRHLDHRPAGLALLGLRDPEPADRAVRRPPRARVGVPDRGGARARRAGGARCRRLLAAQGRIRDRPRARRARLRRAGRPPGRRGEGATRSDPRPRRVEGRLVPRAPSRPARGVAPRRPRTAQGGGAPLRWLRRPRLVRALPELDRPLPPALALEAVIRRATVADEPVLRELWEDFEAEIPESEGFEPETWDEEWVDVRRDIEEGVVCIAEDDGGAIGYMRGRRLERGVMGRITTAYVRPRARRQGVTRALLGE